LFSVNKYNVLNYKMTILNVVLQTTIAGTNEWMLRIMSVEKELLQNDRKLSWTHH